MVPVEREGEIILWNPGSYHRVNGRRTAISSWQEIHEGVRRGSLSERTVMEDKAKNCIPPHPRAPGREWKESSPTERPFNSPRSRKSPPRRRRGSCQPQGWRKRPPGTGYPVPGNIFCAGRHPHNPEGSSERECNVLPRTRPSARDPARRRRVHHGFSKEIPAEFYRTRNICRNSLEPGNGGVLGQTGEFIAAGVISRNHSPRSLHRQGARTGRIRVQLFNRDQEEDPAPRFRLLSHHPVRERDRGDPLPARDRVPK